MAAHKSAGGRGKRGGGGEQPASRKRVRTKRNPQGFTVDRQKMLLGLIRTSGNLTKSLRAMRLYGLPVTREQVMREREVNAEFAADLREAFEHSADPLEMEARRRAIEGVVKPVRYQGKIIGYERVYSDGLLKLLLQAARPEKYGSGSQAGDPGTAPAPPPEDDDDEDSSTPDAKDADKHAKVVHQQLRVVRDEQRRGGR